MVRYLGFALVFAFVIGTIATAVHVEKQAHLAGQVGRIR